MLSRTDFIEVIAEVEEKLRQMGYSEDAIMQTEVEAKKIAEFLSNSREISRELYIMILDTLTDFHR